MKREDAQVLLASTQQLRTHWSGVITSHFSLSLTVNVAIWSYFVTSYVDSMKNSSTAETTFLFLASALSSSLLGLWRLYTRHIDDHIANLYPDFLLYEGVLQVPPDRSTSGYLIKAVTGLDRILLSEQLGLERKVEVISELIKSKRVGNRGHFSIDLFALIAIILMSLLSLFLFWPLSWKLELLFLAGNTIGLISVIAAMKCFQRNPCGKQLDDLLRENQNSKGNHKHTKA